MRQYAVIVAGGSGTRMGGGIPKQFRSLLERPVLWWSMKAFHDENPNTELILVLPEEFIPLWNDLFATIPEKDRFEHLVTIGGNTRTESVVNGIGLIEDEDSLVAIHDGARPLVTKEIIHQGFLLAGAEGAAVPVVPVTDSLRKLNGDSSECVDRNRFVAVQTPQVFKTLLLKKAYREAEDDKVFTDDASVVERMDQKIALFEGSHNNIKITNPKDLAIAKLLMGRHA